MQLHSFYWGTYVRNRYLGLPLFLDQKEGKMHEGSFRLYVGTHFPLHVSFLNNYEVRVSLTQVYLPHNATLRRQ